MISISFYRYSARFFGRLAIDCSFCINWEIAHDYWNVCLWHYMHIATKPHSNPFFMNIEHWILLLPSHNFINLKLFLSFFSRLFVCLLFWICAPKWLMLRFAISFNIRIIQTLCIHSLRNNGKWVFCSLFSASVAVHFVGSFANDFR